MQLIEHLLDEVYADYPPEWVLKEGNQSFYAYRAYLHVISQVADNIFTSRSRPSRLVFLDVGTSMGVVACVCSRLGMDVWGVDNQNSSIHPILKPIRTKYGVNYADYDAMTDNLPLEDDFFNIINCNDVIEHLHGSPKRMLEECRRVLKPAGWLILTTPNHAALHNRLSLLVGRSTYSGIRDWYHNPIWARPVFTGHIREYTVGEMRYMLLESGFTNVKVSGLSLALFGGASRIRDNYAALNYKQRFWYLEGLPFYDRRFHVRSFYDFVRLLYHGITYFLPGMRTTILALAQKKATD